MKKTDLKNTYKSYYKFRTETRYLSYIDYSVSFRRAMDLQINQFVKVLETNDVELYHPVVIR